MGIFTAEEARQMAYEEGLDLVEVLVFAARVVLAMTPDSCLFTSVHCQIDSMTDDPHGPFQALSPPRQRYLISR